MEKVCLEGLIEIVSSSENQIIAIDGVANSGKSTLASKILETLAIDGFDLDDIRDLSKSSYLKQLDYEIISQKITDRKKTIVVHGLFMRQVLERIKIKADVYIYVKRMSKSGYWADMEYSYDTPTEKKISQLESNLSLINKKTVSLGESSRDVFYYHDKYKPHLNTDYIYEWVELPTL
jgi:cytidylate kinase